MSVTSSPRKAKLLSADTMFRGGSFDESLSNRVARQMLDSIIRHFSPDLRLPPFRQIADELNVSVSTINDAIRQLVAAGILVTRKRAGTVLAPGCTIEHVRHRRDHMGRGGRASIVVRVLLSPICDGMTQEMADSFARVIADHGGRVRFENYPRTFCDALEPDDSDATAMFQPSTGRWPIKWRSDTPLVIASTNKVDIDGDACFDQICADEEQGGYLAGRRFRETGHRSVCFVGREDRYGGTQGFGPLDQRRLRGFERGWGEPVPEKYRLTTGSHNLHNGAAAFGSYAALSPRPEGVFCDTDDLAIGFHIGAFTHNLRAGRDFSLIGFDKQQLGLTIPGGPLTTVEVPRQAIGERAATLLLDRLKTPGQPVRRTTLGCTLFEGNTLLSHAKDHTP